MPKKTTAIEVPAPMQAELADTAEFYGLPVDVLTRAVLRAFLDMVEQESSTLDLPLAFQQVPTA